MSALGPPRLGRYLKFLGLATTIGAAVAALGYVPTRRLAGGDGVAAMIAGCAASFVASVASTLPLVLARRERRAQAAMVSMLVRFLVALGLGAALALAELLPARPLLVWLGLSYAALLPLDAHFAATWGREEKEERPDGG